jgi:DNA-directed RNA polymerase subunit M/transcription elongation factor TFIIS
MGCNCGRSRNNKVVIKRSQAKTTTSAGSGCPKCSGKLVYSHKLTRTGAGAKMVRKVACSKCGYSKD